MAIKFDHVTGQGETYTLDATYVDDNDAPYDLTGHTVVFRLYNGVSSSTVVGNYPATVDADGNISVKVADEVTATWPLGNNVYVLIHSSPNGDVDWLATGKLSVKGLT